MTKTAKDEAVPFQSPRHLKGYALTEHLENSPDFVALLVAVKGGEQELPAYLRMRGSHKSHPRNKQ